MKVTRMARAGLVLTIAPLAALAAALAPAGAVTTACSAGDSGFCGGQSTVQAAPAALSVQNIPGSRAGQALVAVTPSATRRQDWDLRVPASGGSGTGGPDKIFRWAPSGVPSNWCATVVGFVQSAVRLERCTGSTDQIWRPAAQATGVNWVNVLTGLALTDVSGAVQVRSVGQGTGLNKRWVFVSNP